jgi:hypothetical protein
MSFFRYLFDSDHFQRADIDRLQASHTFQSLRLRRATRDASSLEADMAGLTLYCRTAVSLMIEKGLITREEFVERMHSIDLADGTLDGRYDATEEDSFPGDVHRAETD